MATAVCIRASRGTSIPACAMRLRRTHTENTWLECAYREKHLYTVTTLATKKSIIVVAAFERVIQRWRMVYVYPMDGERCSAVNKIFKFTGYAAGTPRCHLGGCRFTFRESANISPGSRHSLHEMAKRHILYTDFHRWLG